jgi:hypothetical protein
LIGAQILQRSELAGELGSIGLASFPTPTKTFWLKAPAARKLHCVTTEWWNFFLYCIRAKRIIKSCQAGLACGIRQLPWVGLITVVPALRPPLQKPQPSGYLQCPQECTRSRRAARANARAGLPHPPSGSTVEDQNKEKSEAVIHLACSCVSQPRRANSGGMVAANKAMEQLDQLQQMINDVVGRVRSLYFGKPG